MSGLLPVVGLVADVIGIFTPFWHNMGQYSLWAVLGGVAGWFWANYKEFDEKRCNRLMMFSVIASILLLILTRLFTHQVGQDRVFLIKCDVSVLEGARDEGHAFPWISRASNLVVVLLIVLISFLAMPAVQRLLRKLIVAKCGDR